MLGNISLFINKKGCKKFLNKIKKAKTNLSQNLRKEAVPDDTLSLAKFEYCALALALCTAAVSTADILLKPAVKQKNKQLKNKKKTESKK